MADTRVLVVDMGIGNLTSVANALRVVGAEAIVSTEPREIADATHVIVPGVGAFGDGMALLARGGWLAPLREARDTGEQPMLGICLGMQLLASIGTEHGEHAGLGWVSGTCHRLDSGPEPVRIPHIGWNDASTTKPCVLFEGLRDDPSFYFLHSYVLTPDDPAVVTSVCDHGAGFAASVHVGSVFGVQFHPEKSQRAGLALLDSFVRRARGATC